MDPFCLKLIGGMGTAVVGLAGAVAYLFLSLQKSQEARLEQSKEHERTMDELYETFERRRRKS